MSKCGIVTEEQRDAYVQIWKYLSANGRIFIPVQNSTEVAAVYVEDYPEEKRKVIRSFMDNQSIELYISIIEHEYHEFPPGTLKTGIAPVKTLQTQLKNVYGAESTDDIIVECILTSFDEFGNMQDVDTIWSQINN